MLLRGLVEKGVSAPETACRARFFGRLVGWDVEDECLSSGPWPAVAAAGLITEDEDDPAFEDLPARSLRSLFLKDEPDATMVGLA